MYMSADIERPNSLLPKVFFGNNPPLRVSYFLSRRRQAPAEFSCFTPYERLVPMKKLLGLVGCICLCSMLLFGTTGCPKTPDKPKADSTKPKADDAKPKADNAKPKVDDAKPKVDDAK